MRTPISAAEQSNARQAKQALLSKQVRVSPGAQGAAKAPKGTAAVKVRITPRKPAKAHRATRQAQLTQKIIQLARGHARWKGGVAIYVFTAGQLVSVTATAKSHGLSLSQWLELRENGAALCPIDGFENRRARLAITFADADMRLSVENMASVHGQSAAEFVHSALAERLQERRIAHGARFRLHPKTGAPIRMDDCHAALQYVTADALRGERG